MREVAIWRCGACGLALITAALVSAACGSEDGKKTTFDGEGGAAGQGGVANGGDGPDASGGFAGNDAEPTGGMGVDGGAAGAAGATAEGGAGEGGAPAEPEIVGAYVDCELGSDDEDGTQGHPLKTLAKAASAAPSGTTIVVANGRCDETNQPVFNTEQATLQLPDGVSLRAESPGGVTFHGVDGYRSSGVSCLGSCSISGIHFEVFGSAIQASTGTVDLVDVTFDRIGSGHPIQLTGTAEATLTPGAVTNYIGESQSQFAYLLGSSKLTVRGGVIRGAVDSGISGGTLFTARESSTLVLDGVTLEDNQFSGVLAGDAAHVVVRNGSLIRNTASNACCNQAALRVENTATLELLDSDVEDTEAAAIVLTAGTPSVIVRRSSITNSLSPAFYAAVYSDSKPTLTIEASTISGNSAGIFSNYDTIVDIDDSEFDDNNSNATCGSGILLNPTQVNQIKIRRSRFSGHCLHGVQLVGAVGSSFDLGRADDPGANLFQGNNTSSQMQRGNVEIEAPANSLVHAVGNAWDPGVQGAAPLGSETPPEGHYAVLSGTTYDVTGPAPGPNFVIRGTNAATTTLRLAAEP